MSSRSRGLLIAALALCCKKADPAHNAKTSEDESGKPEVARGSGQPKDEPKPKPASKYATPEAKLRRYGECWNAFNTGKDEVFVGCFALDAVREQVDSVPELVVQGSDKILDMAKAQRASFPDLKVTPQLVIVSGDDILAILHVGGANTGEVPGMKATGKRLGIFEAEVASMSADGTFSHDSLYVDQPTIFHQLGLIENDTSPRAIDQHLAEPATLVSHKDAGEAANKALVERHLEAVNRKNAIAGAAVAADNVKLIFHGDKQKVETKKAYTKWLTETLRSTKDGFVDIKGLWTAGDYVVVADVFTGTPTEEVVGKAAFKHIETHVVQFFRISGGKLEEHQIFANRLKTAVQLGMVDPEELMKTLTNASH